MFNLKLDGETYRQWLQIAVDKKFEQDNDVAQFLIRHYQETSEETSTLRHCIGCMSPVALYTYCDKCNFLVQQTTPRPPQSEEAVALGTAVTDAISSAIASQVSTGHTTAPTVISLQSATPAISQTSDENAVSIVVRNVADKTGLADFQSASPVLPATSCIDEHSVAVIQTSDGRWTPVPKAQLTAPLQTESAGSDTVSVADTQVSDHNIAPKTEAEFASPLPSPVSSSNLLSTSVTQASDHESLPVNEAHLSSPASTGCDLLSTAVYPAQINASNSPSASDCSGSSPGDETITVYVDDAGNIITTRKQSGTWRSKTSATSDLKQNMTEDSVGPISPIALSTQMSGGCSRAERANTNSRKRLCFSEPDSVTVSRSASGCSDGDSVAANKTQSTVKLVTNNERQHPPEPDSTVNIVVGEGTSKVEGFVTTKKKNTSSAKTRASGSRQGPAASSSSDVQKFRAQRSVQAHHPAPKPTGRKKQKKVELDDKITGTRSQIGSKTPVKSSKQCGLFPSKRTSSALSLKDSDQKCKRNAEEAGTINTDEMCIRRSGRERKPTWKVLSTESDSHSNTSMASDATSKFDPLGATAPSAQLSGGRCGTKGVKSASGETLKKQRNLSPKKPAVNQLKSGDAEPAVKDCVVVLERLSTDKADTSVHSKVTEKEKTVAGVQESPDTKKEKTVTDVQDSPEPGSSDEIFVYTDDEDDDYKPDPNEESDEDGNVKPKRKSFDFEQFLSKQVAKQSLPRKTKRLKTAEDNKKSMPTAVVSKSVTSSIMTDTSSSVPVTSGPSAGVSTQVLVDTNGGRGTRVPVQVTLTTKQAEDGGGGGRSIVQAVIQPLDQSGTWEEMSNNLGKYRPILPKPEGYDAEMEKKALEASSAEAEGSGMDGMEASLSKDAASSEEKTEPRPDTRKHGCSVCFKRFFGSNDLRRHMRIHTGERPYLCHDCGASFKLAQGLKHHQLRQACIKHIKRQEKAAAEAAKLSQAGVKGEGYMKRRYVCTVCDKRFMSNNDLKKHMRTHTGERPFACLQCPKRFSLKQALRAHMQCRHPNEIDEAEKAAAEERRQKYLEARQVPRTKDGRYPCEECPKTYPTRRDLKVHMRSHTGEKPYICETCGKGFKYRQNLGLHYRVHNAKRSHICTDCGAAFYTASALDTHSRLHTDERPYVCEECGAAFISMNNLQVHVRTQHSGERSHVCSVCQAAFTTNRQLKIHAKLHTGPKPYTCMECGQGFPTHMEMKQHRKSHSGRAQFTCRQCPEVFSTEKLLALHIETHRETVASPNQAVGQTFPLKCGNCQQEFTELSQLQEHSLKCKRNRCSWCGSTFKSGSRLREHERIHTGERPFLCRVCGAAFRTQALVKTHMRSHTGFKPHVCAVCKKGFSNSGSLNMHMRCHTGERPYGCTFCSLAFSQAAALRRHLYTHTDTTPRPFVCDTCGACFMSEGVLKRHYASHKQAGDRILVCSVCQANIAVPANIQIGTGGENEVVFCPQCSVYADEALGEEKSQISSLTSSAENAEGVSEQICDDGEENTDVFASQDVAEENTSVVVTHSGVDDNTNSFLTENVVKHADVVTQDLENELCSVVTDGEFQENTRIVFTQGASDDPGSIILTNGTTLDGTNIIVTDGVSDENASFIVAEGMVDGNVGVVLADGMFFGEDGAVIQGAMDFGQDQQVYEITLAQNDP